MRERSGASSILFFSVTVACATLSACGQGNGNPANGHGGDASSGNSGLGGHIAASGGASGAGGAGTGGNSSAQGGTTGTGGTVSAGGGSGIGGTTSGGKTSEGGRTGEGGKTGEGGSPDAAPMPKDAMDISPTDAGAIFKDAPATDVAVVTCTGSQPLPKAGDSTVTLQSGGRSRTYVLHVPSGLSVGMALPVVIDLHGAGGNGKQQQGMSGFNSLADKEKFLAIFPDGVDGYWNVDDTCCGTAGKQKIDDVGFLKAIISGLSSQTCIDAKRIYVSGFSNGGGLAHRIGCDAADVIAAIAPTATDLRTQPCKSARPISMMEVKGMADSLEPYDGGVVGPEGGQYTDVGAKASQKLWADIDKCTGTTTTNDNYCESYTQCADGVEVDLCSLPNTDHSTYSNSLGFNVASVAWSMFKRQPMK